MALENQPFLAANAPGEGPGTTEGVSLSAMTTKKPDLVGNVLGDGRAEVDRMLEAAFVETHDYRALTATNDFAFVVGRRGTGKTALFLKVSDFMEAQRGCFLVRIKPEESAMLGFMAALREYGGDYKRSRAVARNVWKAHLLLEVLSLLCDHWKIDRSQVADYISEFVAANRDLMDLGGTSRCVEILHRYGEGCTIVEDVPGAIAKGLQLSRLQDSVRAALAAINRSVVFLFDNLDEGWEATPVSTAVVGGLALTAADLRDAQMEIAVVLFLRDNILRALAGLDPDFTRHIEGNTLRLYWTEDALMHLVAARLRVALSLEHVENDVKVWNRFAQRDLKDRGGFKSCLQYTLYRPRDIVTLLNQSFVLAGREGREAIIGDDVERTATHVSKDRLRDLGNEYDGVFPGLEHFVEIFRGRPAVATYSEVVGALQDTIESSKHRDRASADFALMNDGEELFHALYSIGFIGLQDEHSNSVRFCHDGSSSDLASVRSGDRAMIHPCYWKALDARPGEVAPEILVDVHDEYEVPKTDEVKDQRKRLLGQLISELPKMETGNAHASDFEDWVFRVAKILFSGTLQNPELKPNPSAVQQRDVVATNMAQTGFWRRVRDDYQSRQVVFEVKNYVDLKIEDYRQAVTYASKDYGNFVAIISRTQHEGLGDRERAWVQEMHHQKQTLVFLIPASVLVRCIRKLRNPERTDYTEKQLNKRLDTYVRRYLAIDHG